MTFFFLHIQSTRLPISHKPFLSLLTATHRSAFSTKAMQMQDLSYLTHREAAQIDETLMGPLGFTVDQLMVSTFSSSFLPFFFCSASFVFSSSSCLQELAGLSVATSIAEVINRIPFRIYTLSVSYKNQTDSFSCYLQLYFPGL